ncbi:MAG: protein kinase [Polyangiaceae bacterium]|nr:protein kinase [Polyangiaceae bacterium]
MNEHAPPSSQSLGALRGKLVEGRYRFDKKVGEGGFGVVYQGFHLALGVQVAIKVLRYPDDANAAARAGLLSQFLAEAQLLPRLRHPNIVSALDVGSFRLENEETPVAFLVLEWCGSETLKTDLRARRGRGGRSVDEAYRIARPIIDAIAHAHERGFVHRDIKPANVMLVPSPDGVSPRVIDFGIAKPTPPADAAGSGTTGTHSDHRAFSLPYAAPEQIAATRTGPWTDVHALALVLTELLVDQAPYGEGDVALGVIDPKRPTPAAFGVEVGPWEAVLSRALSLRPNERFKDARALLEALDGTLDEARRIWGRAAGEARTTALAIPSNDPRHDDTDDADSADAPRSHTERGTTTQGTISNVSRGVTPASTRALSGTSERESVPPRRRRFAAMAIAVMVAVAGAATLWRFTANQTSGERAPSERTPASTPAPTTSAVATAEASTALTASHESSAVVVHPFESASARATVGPSSTGVVSGGHVATGSDQRRPLSPPSATTKVATPIGPPPPTATPTEKPTLW